MDIGMAVCSWPIVVRLRTLAESALPPRLVRDLLLEHAAGAEVDPGVDLHAGMRRKVNEDNLRCPLLNYSSFTLAAFTTFAHLSISLFSQLPSCSGVMV